MSIFDELREIVCKKFKDKVESNRYTDEEKNDCLKKEYLKLNNLPVRPSFNDRVKRMNHYFGMQRLKKHNKQFKSDS